MSIFQSVLAARLIFILGILNLLSLAAIFATCRCLPASRFGKGLMENRFYRKIFKYHCYVWYVLWVSVIVHAFFAIMFAGIPF
ncbi:MAG: hypothetical protein C4555_02460 [Dehalococcoidia bacterium]|jgi:hypothetical protein|nr:MAG: hypothetical protein C4555_02460 [Dehalococcoidia bacterium]